MGRSVLFFGLFFVLFLFVGCATGGQKIVIPSYTAPKEVSKLSKIKTKDKYLKDGTYLAIWLNPEVKGVKKTDPRLKEFLIQSVKEKITQTNFIAIDPLGDDNGVTLSMNVLEYDYKKIKNKISLYLEVSFTLSRNSDEFFVKTYSDRKNRQSKDISLLPTKNQLTSQAVQKVVKYFISDISPLKTYQLREFKVLPKSLDGVFVYVQRKNYKGAIKIMNYYKGEKDMDFYYDLAILYEALASESENLKILKLANESYSKSIALGGSSDTMIMDAKARFDNFYELLIQTKEQQRSNKVLIDERNSLTGSTDSEYR